MERLLAEGERAELLTTFFREIVQMGEEELRALQEAPTWPARVAAAHTVPRELRAFAGQVLDPIATLSGRSESSAHAANVRPPPRTMNTSQRRPVPVHGKVTEAGYSVEPVVGREEGRRR